MGEKPSKSTFVTLGESGLKNFQSETSNIQRKGQALHHHRPYQSCLSNVYMTSKEISSKAELIRNIF